MIDFSTVQAMTIPEGVVTQIVDASNRVIWAAPNAAKATLEVENNTDDV